MRSLVYLTTRLPSQILNDLETAGYEVFEALEISEVWHLCEHQKIDAVVIAPDVEDQHQVEIQIRQPTIRMTRKTSAKDILWELSTLFPDAKQRVQ
jgi:hypothetical protein